MVGDRASGATTNTQPFGRLDFIPTTAFVGRTAEIAEITRLLCSAECRLVTLYGVGGIGKTRLATQVASALQPNFPDGVHLVPLQPASSSALLVPAIADALGLALSGHTEPTEQLITWLREREMLLVLDNFEHLLDGADLVARLLSAADRLKLLVTSRAVLHLQHEWLFEVRGLAWPDQPGSAAVERYSAVQLFVERARRVRPDFSLAVESADVVRICQLTEGMPLAIELAAAWLTTLDCRSIAYEIEANVHFLASSLRDIPDRHRSIQAVFEQFWHMLSAEQRSVFTRLSVFRGSFTREAAEAIAGASLTSLSALVDKSLVQREPHGRYHIHELLRQFAQERLEDPGSVRDRHTSYYLDFVSQRLPRMLGGDQQQASAEIAAELDNIRAAWQAAVEQARIADLHAAVHSLSLFHQFQSRYSEGVAALERAAEGLEKAPISGGRDSALAQVLALLAWLYIRVGQIEQAEQVSRRSQDLLASLSARPAPGMANEPMLPLAVIATITGDYERAASLAAAACSASRLRDEPWTQEIGHYVQARAALVRGDYQAAREYAQHAYALTLATNNQWFMAYCLNELGNIAYAAGDLAGARGYYQSTYELRAAFGDVEGMALALTQQARLALQEGDMAEARELYSRALHSYREITDRGGQATALAGLGAAALAAGEQQAASRYLYDALCIAVAIQHIPLILSLLAGTAELLLQHGRRDNAARLLAIVLHSPASSHETRLHAQDLLRTKQLAAVSQAPQPAELSSVTTETLAELTALEEHQPRSEPAASASYPRGRGLVEPLTQRELEVLRLMGLGLSNQAIADDLVLALGTVKRYTHSIYGKLGVTNRVEAVLRATALGLLPDSPS